MFGECMYVKCCKIDYTKFLQYSSTIFRYKMLKRKSFLLPLNNSQPIVVTVVLLSVKRIYDVIHRHYTVLCKTNIVDEKFQLESSF